MQKSYCIVCGRQRNGIEVQDDFVLGTIRWLKENVTHNAKNNRLVVCKDCYPKYTVSRKKFEFRERVYLTLGILFAMLSLFISPRPATLLISILIVAFLYSLSLLTYTPRINIKKQPKQ